MDRGGRGAGFTLIELQIVIAVIAVIASIAIPNLLDVRNDANESSAVSSLRFLVQAQVLFRDTDRDGDGIVDFAESLAEFGILIDQALRSGRKQGYIFRLVRPEPLFYCVLAHPQRPPTSGERVFTVSDRGVIRAALGRLPGPGDELDEEPSDPNDRDCAALFGDVDLTPPDLPLSFLVFGETVESVSRRAVLRLDQLPPEGGTLLGAVDLSETLSSNTVVEVLDGDGSGDLSFVEVIETDLLAAARLLAPPKGTGDTPIGEDAELQVLLQLYRSELKALLELDIDPPQPGIPTDPLPAGDPQVFLTEALLVVGKCGNGVLDGVEECDDGDFVARDGCSDCLDDICGDANADDRTDLADVDLLRNHFIDAAGGLLSVAGEKRCNVIQPLGPCDILDLVVLRRALAFDFRPPGIAPVCSAFVSG